MVIMMVLINRATNQVLSLPRESTGNASYHKKAINMDARMDSLGLNPGGATHGSVTWAVI